MDDGRSELSIGTTKPLFRCARFTIPTTPASAVDECAIYAVSVRNSLTTVKYAPVAGSHPPCKTISKYNLESPSTFVRNRSYACTLIHPYTLPKRLNCFNAVAILHQDPRTKYLASMSFQPFAHESLSASWHNRHVYDGQIQTHIKVHIRDG